MPVKKIARRRTYREISKNPRTVTSVSFNPALLARIDEALDIQNKDKFYPKSRSCYIQELITIGMNHASDDT